MPSETAPTPRVFFFTDFEGFPPQVKRSISRMPGSVVSSNHLSISFDLRHHQSQALVIDTHYCRRKSLWVRGLLEGLPADLKQLPVYLVNANFSEFESLISRAIVHAVMEHVPDPDTLLESVEKYQEMRRKTGDNHLLRQDLSVPCLIKRIGAAGISDGQVMDLSPQGMKVRVPLDASDWEIGDEVRFSISGSTRFAVKDHIEGRAAIRWTRKLDSNDPAFVVGLCFVDIPDSSRVQISGMLNDARQ